MACKFPEFNLNVGCKKCPIKDCVASEQPDPKPLARFLAGYIAYDVDGRDIDRWGTIKWRELLEQALDAYEREENVTVEIKKL